MARYYEAVPDFERNRSPRLDYLDLRQSPPSSIISPVYGHADVDYRDTSHSAMIRAPHNHGHSRRYHSPTVIEEPVIEHEHHHVHHHIDHGTYQSLLVFFKELLFLTVLFLGDITAQSLVLNRASQHSQHRLTHQYSFEDIDVDERRYDNVIHNLHNDDQPRRRRRHRHRSRRGSRTRISQSEVDVTNISIGSQSDHDDVTVVDVPAGSRRIYVNIDKSQPQKSYSERDSGINWRREHGIRRSRGLGNELWTEITKDLITREAIEHLDYPFEETDYFYYIFEYLDRDQIMKLRDLTDDIRHGKHISIFFYRSTV
jgi:hypothetical protein